MKLGMFNRLGWVIIWTIGLVAISLGQSRPIRDLRRNNNQGIPLLKDSIVTISGIVTVANQFGYSGPGFIQDSTGGVALYDTLVNRLSIGDYITVTGRCTVYAGLTELKALRNLTIHSRGNFILPKLMTIPEVGVIDTAGGYVENEGWFIQIDSVRIINAPTDTFAGNTNYTIEDKQGRTGTIRIDGNCSDIVGKPIPINRFNLVGVISQFVYNPPHFGGYQIMPRFWFDLGGSYQFMTIAEAIRDLDNNTIPDLLDSTVTVTGIVTVPFGVFARNRTDLYIQDHTAGVNIYDGARIFQLKLGDSVIVTGKIYQYRGKTEIISPQIIVVGTNHPLPEPVVLNCQRINREEYEGSLVKLVGINSNAFVLEGNTSYLVFDSSGSGTLYIDADSDIPSLLVVFDTFSVIGIKSQYTTDTTPPFNTGYQIVPRFRTDFSRNLRDELPLLTVNEVQRPGSDGFTSAYEGRYVKVRGRLTGPNRIFGSSYSTSFFIQDSTGGINAYSMMVNNNQTNWLDSIGAEFECIGKVTEYNGLTEIANGVAYLMDSVLIPIYPRELRFGLPLTESMESDLITVVGDVNSLPVTSGSAQNFIIRNGSPAITVRVLNNTMIPLNWISTDKRIRVTGIVGQYDTDYPFNTGYQILVRFPADLKDTSQFMPSAATMRIDTIIPNPFAPSRGEVMTIKLNSPSTYRLYLEIYDLEGRLVVPSERLKMKNVPGRYYEVQWDGTDERGERLPIGIYILNLKGIAENGKTEFIRKTILIATQLR